MASSDTGADSLRAAPATSSGVVKLGKLETGDFFGESAILLPHSAKGIARTRSVYGVRSDDPPYHEVHLYVLSNEDVNTLEASRPAIAHMLKPYRRQAIRAKYAQALMSGRSGQSVQASSLRDHDAFLEEDEEEEEESASSGSRSASPRDASDAFIHAHLGGGGGGGTVSRLEFDGLRREVGDIQTKLETMDTELQDKLNQLLDKLSMK